MKHGAPDDRGILCNTTNPHLRVHTNAIPALLAFALLLGGLTSPAAAQSRPAPDDQLVLTGATIYVSPTAAPIPNGVLLIRDGKIAAVGPRGSVQLPKGAATLDCSGLTITPGFWNSHVHFFERKWTDAANIPAPELSRQLQAMLTRYGFTSVYDLGSPGENTRLIRHRIESGELPGPRIRSTGEALLGKGWLPPAAILGVLGVMPFTPPEASSGEEARAAAQQLLDAGADGLKFFAVSPGPPNAILPDEAIRAAIEETHRRKKLVFVHPGNRDGLLAAVRGGVDVIAHTTPPSGPWDETILSAMRKANVALIPTLKIWIYQLRHDRASLADARAGIITGQLRAWLASGGGVLFGTDVGGMDDYDPADEYALMAESGMSFPQILASLTTAPAEKFGDAARLGRIAPGFVADLVVLNADPAHDVRALASVRYTLRDGKLIYQPTR